MGEEDEEEDEVEEDVVLGGAEVPALVPLVPELGLEPEREPKPMDVKKLWINETRKCQKLNDWPEGLDACSIEVLDEVEDSIVLPFFFLFL